ncbi:hypothetical protein [Amycolatopsis sp. NPDC051903]|uniref:hypothetical protein n=1 Tax=Amycolatopsis sp. NPDC051903 TaxID=3363936 RepID=UPI0037B542FF
MWTTFRCSASGASWLRLATQQATSPPQSTPAPHGTSKRVGKFDSESGYQESAEPHVDALGS